MRGVPAQYTNDPAVLPSRATLDTLGKIGTSVGKAAALAKDEAERRGLDPYETEEYRLLAQLRDRKEMLEPENAQLRTMFRRWDNFYYPEQTTIGGPDHWPEDPANKTEGRAHVSINVHPVYVEIPATLQAVTPVENYVPASGDEEARAQAGRAERLYFEWKEEDEFELKVHRACVVKALYGFTYGKVYWDPIEKRPTVTIIDQPENLYVGWGNSDFTRMDYAIYCYGLSPQAIREEFGLSVQALEVSSGSYVPYVSSGDHADPLHQLTPEYNDRGARVRTAYERMQVEVYDYWYKKPAGKGKRPEIWNAIFVGNRLVKNKKHTEYDDLPYIPLPNTYVPGLPWGKSELYDIEQLLREKDERVTNAAQMIQSIVGGQMWQIIGSDAPDDVPPNAIPKPGKVATPGPNAELKAIQPFMPQFAIEDFLKRLDVELETVSGLNELLLGRAPATILGSSKAIAALVANYEARIQMKRNLLYQWRRKVWKMAAMVWERKSSDVREIIDGHYRLEIKAPELTPRDELENAQRAINLVQNRIWSAQRAMDATGVEDPEEEIAIIQLEQTDPTMNPQAVLQQATLLGTFQQLGIQPPQGSINSAQNAVRQVQRPAGGSASLNGPENAANPPGEALPANAQAPNGAPAAEGGNAVLQTLVDGKGAQGRVLTQTPLGKEAA